MLRIIKKSVYLLVPIFFALLILHSVAQSSQKGQGKNLILPTKDSITILPGWEKIDRGIDFKKVNI